MTVMNTIVADTMAQITAWIREAGGGPDAVFKAIKRAIKESSPARFDGNGYSDEWVVEAERRGLKNLRKTPEALAELRAEANVAVFVRHGVLSAGEVEARYNVLTEQFVKAADIESDLIRSLVDGAVLPSAYEELTKLAALPATVGQGRLAKLTGLVTQIEQLRVDLDAAWAQVHHSDDHGPAVVSVVQPVFNALREAVDIVEDVVSDSVWTLPKYREMLFLF